MLFRIFLPVFGENSASDEKFSQFPANVGVRESVCVGEGVSESVRCGGVCGLRAGVGWRVCVDGCVCAELRV